MVTSHEFVTKTLYTMINEKCTRDLFGYLSIDLKPKSHKLIVVTCPDCNKNRNIPKSSYNYPGYCISCGT